MLDIKFIRENPSLVEKGVRSKKCDVNVDHILHIDREYRDHRQNLQSLQEERNVLNEQIKKNPDQWDKEGAQFLKQKLEKEERSVRDLTQQLHDLLLKLPNLPKSDVPIGEDESGNKVIRKYKEPAKFDFQPKDHLALGESLDLIDVTRAAKVSGSRFGYLRNEAVLMEFGLVQLALEMLLKEKFIPILPPALIRPNITKGLGYWEESGHNDYYLVYDPDEKREKDEYEGFYLVGTAEHSIVPMHADELLSGKDLPIRYVGFSPAFRREAGSYGKDARGIFRVHQFDKVEMVSFVKEGEDDKEHEYLLSLEEKLFQALDIPYQVIQMCTGDLGFPAARKYDIEAWIPSQEKYREVTSVSTVTDFQSRRLNIRYQDNPPAGGGKKFVHILNGTAFAVGRTIIAILENYQQEDGSVVIPEVLRKYVGKDAIK